MLYYFLDSEAYQKLVDTLHSNPFLEYKVNNDKQTTKHKGKYTVILINFLSLAQSSYPSFLSQLDIMMKKLYAISLTFEKQWILTNEIIMTIFLPKVIQAQKKILPISRTFYLHFATLLLSIMKKLKFLRKNAKT